jgi:hypothetical protein
MKQFVLKWEERDTSTPTLFAQHNSNASVHYSKAMLFKSSAPMRDASLTALFLCLPSITREGCFCSFGLVSVPQRSERFVSITLH